MNLIQEIQLQYVVLFSTFMRSLSTKVTKIYDIDITLILMQLHLILSSSVGILL